MFLNFFIDNVVWRREGYCVCGGFVIFRFIYSKFYWGILIFLEYVVLFVFLVEFTF